MRIRRADASTGGPVTIRSAAVRYLVARLITASATRLAAPADKRESEKLEALKPDIAELGRKSSGSVSVREVWALARKRGVNPFAALSLSIGAQVAAHLLCVLVAPKRQGVSDLVAGIATVRDDVRPR